MSWTWMIVILAAAVLPQAWRRPRQREKDSFSLYVAGLHLLLEGKQAEALHTLQEAVRQDSNNIEAYLKIGDILREQGHTERALQIHRQLSIRSGLTDSQREQILHSLAKDYEAVGRFDDALSCVRQVQEINRKSEWALDTEIRLYELAGRWEEAYSTLKKASRASDEDRKRRLAYYRVKQGQQLAEKGQPKDAQECFREATKIAPTFHEAYLNLSNARLAEGRSREALQVLKDFMKANPDQAPLVFKRIKEILFEIGEFGEIEKIYDDLIATNPDQIETYLARAEIHAKKGEWDRAIRLCHAVLERRPNDTRALGMLVNYYHRNGDDRTAVQHALRLATAVKSD